MSHMSPQVNWGWNRNHVSATTVRWACGTYSGEEKYSVFASNMQAIIQQPAMSYHGCTRHQHAIIPGGLTDLSVTPCTFLGWFVPIESVCWGIWLAVYRIRWREYTVWRKHRWKHNHIQALIEVREITLSNFSVLFLRMTPTSCLVHAVRVQIKRNTQCRCCPILCPEYIWVFIIGTPH
jgi:hypothetical protein